MEVSPNKEPIKDILNKCEILLKTLQGVDKKVIIAIYKGVDNKESITRESKNPLQSPHCRSILIDYTPTSREATATRE